MDCPSSSWDSYYESQENPDAERIHEWIVSQIEYTRNRIGGGVSVHRDFFKPEDGWPEDPSEIADEICNFFCNYGILTEAAILLSKIKENQDV